MSSQSHYLVRGVLEQVQQDEMGLGDGLSAPAVTLIKRTPALEATSVAFALIEVLGDTTVSFSSIQREIAGDCLLVLLPKVANMTLVNIGYSREAIKNIPNARIRANLVVVLKRAEFEARKLLKSEPTSDAGSGEDLLDVLTSLEKCNSKNRFSIENLEKFKLRVGVIGEWIFGLENRDQGHHLGDKKLSLLIEGLFLVDEKELALRLILCCCKVVSAGKPFSYAATKRGIELLESRGRWSELYLLLWLVEPVRLRAVLTQALGGEPTSSDLYLYLPSLSRVESLGIAAVVTPKVNQWFESRLAFEDWFTFEEWERTFSPKSILSPLKQSLVWQFDNRSTSVIWGNDDWFTSQGKRFVPADDFRITVWHPALSRPDWVEDWQTYFILKEKVQPIRQVFREVYHLPVAVLDGNEDIQQFRERVNFKKFLVMMRPKGWRLEINGYNTWPGYPFKLINEQRYGATLVLIPEDITSRQFPDFAQIEELFIVDGDGVQVSAGEIPLAVMSDLLREVDFLVRSSSAHLASEDEYDLGGLPESPGQIMREKVLFMLMLQNYPKLNPELDKNSNIRFNNDWLIDLRGRQIWNGAEWKELPRKQKLKSDAPAPYLPYEDALLIRAWNWLQRQDFG